MKNDHRVRLTKMLLRQSLLELMRERPIEKVSVKDICDGAGVNRATFYSHYSGAAALLDEIRGEVSDSILRSVNTTLTSQSLLVFVTEICRFIISNATYCQVLFGRYADEAFLSSLLDSVKQPSVANWQRMKPGASQEELSRLYDFVSHGCVAIISRWVQGGMEESPEEIAVFIEKASMRGLEAF